MKFNLTDLDPWPDLHMMLQNMLSLTVVVDSVEYRGEADLTLDEGSRAAVLTVMKPKRPPSAAKAQAATRADDEAKARAGNGKVKRSTTTKGKK